MEQSTEVIPAASAMPAKVPAAKANIQAYLRGAGFEQEIAKLVGSLDIAKRFARVALTQVMADGKLLNCTTESLCRSFYKIAEAGLEPGRDAYLIPRGQECTTIIRWEGYVRAARASGEIKRIWANVIRKGDRYAIRAGSLSPGIDHGWDLEATRGDIIGAYACAEWADGTVETEVLTRDYLDRCKAQSGTSGPSSPWVRWHDRMCLKTAIKRLCERLPLGSKASDALAALERIDDEADGSVVEEATAEPVPTKTDQLAASLKTRKPRAAATTGDLAPGLRTRFAKACTAAGFAPQEIAAWVDHVHPGQALDSLTVDQLQELASKAEEPSIAKANLDAIKNI